MKKLTKSTNNIVLTGTLGGIAEYVNIDPTIVRILYVFISMVGVGSPVLLYIVMALIIPKGRRTENYEGGHRNRYYTNNDYYKKTSQSRKEAEKVEDDDWGDF